MRWRALWRACHCGRSRSVGAKCPQGTMGAEAFASHVCFRDNCLPLCPFVNRCILWPAKCTVCVSQNAAILSTSHLPAVIRNICSSVHSVTRGMHILRLAECSSRDKLLRQHCPVAPILETSRQDTQRAKFVRAYIGINVPLRSDGAPAPAACYLILCFVKQRQTGIR